ncbi:hypothetical protein ACFV4P_33910 [Kitasatospora sp. NPDC059795]|uniref:hypothetical protein n=1 Tax=Kitasatospora sp. NPDC059795 TaxID=3346949 RepID=UPI0036528901
MARTLWMAGSPITDAMCILERPLGGRQPLAEHRITLHSLLTEAALPVPQAGDAA